jgi:chemotaxis protein MotB
MRRSAKFTTFSLLLSLPLLAGGCVQQEKYDALLMSNRSLQEQNVALGAERDESRASLDTVRGQLGKASAELNALKNKYNIVDADLQRMLAETDDMMKRVGNLDFGPLPENLSRDLEALAAQHPDMLSFDAKKGMLRFASDFTFPSGSADLTSSASSSLNKLASILNSPTASKFETRIVGHTDNVPISQPGTRAKHPTNWHLSAHRSISVASSLMSSGVSPTRVTVAGCGEYRPVVTNPAKGGAKENRRVEIFLLPMPEATTMTAGVPTSSSMDDGEPMK